MYSFSRIFTKNFTSPINKPIISSLSVENAWSSQTQYTSVLISTLRTVLILCSNSPNRTEKFNILVIGLRSETEVSADEGALLNSYYYIHNIDMYITILCTYIRGIAKK